MIHHTIEFTKSGYRLVIWEPAPKTRSRVSPFLFRATYLLSSRSKAIEVLNMVKGDYETIFSPASHQLIDKQTEQDFYQSTTDKLPVALPS
ncbi:MAG TPA: hypothetical protein V6C91_21725 [Coleofasciculaceae cyanobacterium]